MISIIPFTPVSEEEKEMMDTFQRRIQMEAVCCVTFRSIGKKRNSPFMPYHLYLINQFYLQEDFFACSEIIIIDPRENSDLLLYKEGASWLSWEMNFKQKFLLNKREPFLLLPGAK